MTRGMASNDVAPRDTPQHVVLDAGDHFVSLCQ